MKIPMIALALTVAGMTGGGTVWAIDRFATKLELAAVNIALIQEIDKRSLGSIINDIKIAVATGNRRLLLDLCLEWSLHTDKPHPRC